MKFKIILEPSDEGGYTAIVPSLPGCISEGDSKEDAMNNIREAIELYLEPIDDDFDYNPKSEIMELAL
ncbi:type II toxin-antitoxin system HicB family antitoxin [candidate division KSB1 bacterium]|nr:type II toxin-antitoxin system HicB family antitoxin [candidate division KSB1 bacterium]